MSIYIYLNSKEATYTTDNPAEFTATLNNTSFYSQNTYISLHQVSFINSEYPINSKNNTLIFEENGNTPDLTATITAGSYTITEFQTVLKDALETAGLNTYSITYNSNTKKLTIDAGANTLRIVGGSILEYIGFEASSSFASSITGSHNINLSGTTYYDVVLSLPFGCLKSGNYYGNIAGRIPVQNSYGDLVVGIFDHEKGIPLSTENLDEIRVEIFDDRGQRAELSKNTVVSIVLKVD